MVRYTASVEGLLQLKIHKINQQAILRIFKPFLSNLTCTGYKTIEFPELWGIRSPLKF